MVEHVRVLSSGHLQTTFVLEPSTDEAAAVVLSDPGRQTPDVFLLIVVISLTPATGWQQKVRKRSEDMRRPLPYISHARSHLGRCLHRWQPSVLAAGEQLCLFLVSSETGGEALLPGKRKSGAAVLSLFDILMFNVLMKKDQTLKTNLSPGLQSKSDLSLYPTSTRSK